MFVEKLLSFYASLRRARLTLGMSFGFLPEFRRLELYLRAGVRQLMTTCWLGSKLLKFLRWISMREKIRQHFPAPPEKRPVPCPIDEMNRFLH